jgi:hypothetical protein
MGQWQRSNMVGWLVTALHAGIRGGTERAGERRWIGGEALTGGP